MIKIGIIGVEKKNEPAKELKRSDFFRRVLFSPEPKSSSNTKRKSSSVTVPNGKQFWIKKQIQDQLDSTFKDVLKNRYYYMAIRLFLIRNVKSSYEYINLIREKRRARMMTLKYGHGGNKGSSTRRQVEREWGCPKPILERRRRGLDTIIEELS
jgi:hypothetical protein